MKYWLFHNNQVAGPYDLEALAGVPGFCAESLVCPEGRRGTQMGDWQRAGVVAELAELLMRPARVPAGSAVPAGGDPGGSRLPPEPTLRDIAELGALQERVQQLESSLDRVREELRDREGEISELKSSLEGKTQETSRLREQMDALEGRLSETESLRERLGKAQEGEAEQSRAMESLRSELESLRASLEAMRSGYAAQSAVLADPLAPQGQPGSGAAPGAFDPPSPDGGPAPLPDLGGALEPLPSFGEPEPAAQPAATAAFEPAPAAAPAAEAAAPGDPIVPQGQAGGGGAPAEIEIPDVAPSQAETPAAPPPADVSIGQAHPTESGPVSDPLADLGAGPADAGGPAGIGAPEAEPSPLFAAAEEPAPAPGADLEPPVPISFPQPKTTPPAPELEPMSPLPIEEGPAALGAPESFEPPPLEPAAGPGPLLGPGDGAEIPNTLVGDQNAPPPADFSALGMATPVPAPVGGLQGPAIEEGLVDLTRAGRRRGRGKGFLFLLLLILTGGGAAAAVYLGYLDLDSLKSKLPPELAAKISEVLRTASQAAGTAPPQQPAGVPEAPPDRSGEALQFAKERLVDGRTLASILDPSPAPGISPWTVQPLGPSRYEVDFFPRTGGGSPPYRFEVDLDAGSLRALDDASRRILSGNAPAPQGAPYAPGTTGSGMGRTPGPSSSLLGGGLGEDVISGKKPPSRAARRRGPRPRRRASKPPAALGGLLEQDGPDLELPGLAGKAKAGGAPPAGGKDEDLSLDELLLPGIPKKRQ